MGVLFFSLVFLISLPITALGPEDPEMVLVRLKEEIVSKFILKRERRGEQEVFYLGGMMTGVAGLQFINLYEGVSRCCTFNFRDVHAINSEGLQAWMLFIRDFINDHEVCLEECTHVIVDQMNMLPSFTANATVTSVYVPYHCQNCNKVDMKLIVADQFPIADQISKAPDCPICGGARLLDDPDCFSFLNYKQGA
jgi:hypothetical protein